MITHIDLIHELVRCLIHTRLLVVEADHLAEGLAVACVVHEHDPVVTDAALVLIVALVVEIVAAHTGEAELVLAIEDEVLVVVELVFEALDLDAHPGLLFDSSFHPLCTHLWFLLKLLHRSSTFSPLLQRLIRRCFFPASV